MKQLVFSIIVILFSAGDLDAQLNNTGMNPGSGVIKWNETTKDFGELLSGQCKTIEFKFVNAGTGPVTINSASTYNRNTSSSFIKTPVAPLDSGFVKVDFRASVGGKFDIPIKVDANVVSPELHVVGIVKKSYFNPK